MLFLTGVWHDTVIIEGLVWMCDSGETRDCPHTCCHGSGNDNMSDVINLCKQHC